MGRNLQFTSLDRVIAKLYRDLGVEEVSETNLLEWSAEALEFISTPNTYETAVNLLEIKNHQADLPIGLHAIIQVARDNEYKEKDLCEKTEYTEKDNEDCEVEIFNCPECFQELDSEILTLPTLKDLEPKVINNLIINNGKSRFTPGRLSNHTLFNSLACMEDSEIYKSCKDEYTIVNNKIRTSFKEGFILLSYYRVMIDEETGYPLIPDDVSIINAITYYIMWKYNQRLWFMGREGYNDKMQYAEQQWLKYCGQAKANQTILSGLDEYQNFTEEKYNWLKSFKYYNYFGNLGRQDFKFKNNKIIY